MLPRPVQAVFGHVADPARLADWLPQVAAASAGPGSRCGAGAEFRVTLQADGAQFAATGEVTAYEPPWLVGYRMLAGGRTASIRVTCTTQPGGTRIHIHQPDGVPPLTVDLARLIRALGSGRPAPENDSHA